METETNQTEAYMLPCMAAGDPILATGLLRERGRALIVSFCCGRRRRHAAIGTGYSHSILCCLNINKLFVGQDLLSDRGREAVVQRLDQLCAVESNGSVTMAGQNVID